MPSTTTTLNSCSQPAIDMLKLPESVRAKLAQLDLELTEGDITEKGYEKKRRQLIEPFLKKSIARYARQKIGGVNAAAKEEEEEAAKVQKHRRRTTRNESRYHSEIRQEAVHLALAQLNNNKKEQDEEEEIEKKMKKKREKRRSDEKEEMGEKEEEIGRKEEEEKKEEGEEKNGHSSKKSTKNEINKTFRLPTALGVVAAANASSSKNSTRSAIPVFRPFRRRIASRLSQQQQQQQKFQQTDSSSEEDDLSGRGMGTGVGRVGGGGEVKGSTSSTLDSGTAGSNGSGGCDGGGGGGCSALAAGRNGEVKKDEGGRRRGEEQMKWGKRDKEEKGRRVEKEEKGRGEEKEEKGGRGVEKEEKGRDEEEKLKKDERGRRVIEKGRKGDAGNKKRNAEEEEKEERKGKMVDGKGEQNCGRGGGFVSIVVEGGGGNSTKNAGTAFDDCVFVDGEEEEEDDVDEEKKGEKDKKRRGEAAAKSEAAAIKKCAPKFGGALKNALKATETPIIFANIDPKTTTRTTAVLPDNNKIINTLLPLTSSSSSPSYSSSSILPLQQPKMAKQGNVNASALQDTVDNNTFEFEPKPGPSQQQQQQQQQQPFKNYNNKTELSPPPTTITTSSSPSHSSSSPTIKKDNNKTRTKLLFSNKNGQLPPQPPLSREAWGKQQQQQEQQQRQQQQEKQRQPLTQLPPPFVRRRTNIEGGGGGGGSGGAVVAGQQQQHHHQLMANRTSVLLLEDRPLPELPLSSSDEEDVDEVVVGEPEEEEECCDGAGVGGGGGEEAAVYVNSSTNDSGLGGSSNAPQDYANTKTPLKPARVSKKIQQVLHSLQKPRQRPLQDYYNDDDAELEAMANILDANAPRPTGQVISPCRADFPGSGASATTPPPPPLPRSIDTALHKWANTQPKAAAAVQFDTNAGKPTTTLTYAKLLSRAAKISYALLNRTVLVSAASGSGKERVHLCIPGDRVALLYPNNEAPAFLCAFYGCLLAGVVPVPIEVPTVKRRDSAGIQQFGFLLGSCGVHVALTTERCLKGLPRGPQQQHQSSNSSNNNNFSSSTSHGGPFSSPSSSSASATLSPTSSQRDPSQSPGQGSSQQQHHQNNDLTDFKCWPRLHWLVTENLPKPAREWTLPSLLADDTIAYIEYSTDREGSVKGVSTSRQAMLAHARALCSALDYKEGHILICVLDFKRETGLWHACIAAIYAGMRVLFVPYSLMKVNPTCWLQQATQQSAQFALVKSRDLHWSLLAVRDHAQLQLSSLQCILISDGANPWALSSCDQFTSVFAQRGLSPTAICPCIGSPEAGTVALRRPFRPPPPPPLQQNQNNNNRSNERNNNNSNNSNLNNNNNSNNNSQRQQQPKWGSGRGTLSMLALSHCVVRLEPENSMNSLAVQDSGQVIPGGMAVVVQLNGAPRLCRADEIGEICLHAASTSNCFHGLKGLSQGVFSVLPLGADDRPIGPLRYVRSGLVGFLGPEGLVFAVGAKQSLLHVSGRVHSGDDLIATVLAVEPLKFIYRGRIAVFSIRVLRDERICIVAEQRPEVNEEDAFPWMVRVLQAIDSVHHQLGIYCISLVLPNQLPKTPLGGIHVTETRQRFLDGCLHPTTLLMCPQHCVLNLPKPREPPADVGPAAMFVGNIVQGARIAGAQGQELPAPGSDECCSLIEILKQRAQQTPDHVLYSVLNSRGTELDSLTCAQLLKKAERIAALLLEKGRLTSGDHVAVIFPPGLDLIAAVFGCFCASLVPVCIRPPSAQNLQTSMLTVRMIVEVSKAVALLSNAALIKLLKSKEVFSLHVRRTISQAWPTILDIEDAPSLSVARNKAAARRHRESFEEKKAKNSPSSSSSPTSLLSLSGRETSTAAAAAAICYLDFVVSTTGQLSGVQMTVQAVANECRSLKLACELYPSRNVTLCLDPCSGGLSFTLWCLSSVYSGHQSTLIPPLEMEQNPLCWMQALTQSRTRDTFCSPNMIELCCSELAPQLGQLKERGISLSSLRNCIIVAEERPRVQLCTSFMKLFAPLGLTARAVSTAFGCRVNPAICMQSASCPDPSSVFVDARALRNDRVTLVEKGAPHSICLMESGKLLPGVKVAIANPKTRGQCADTHLGEIWVSSGHNANGFFSIGGGEQQQRAHQSDHFNARLSTGDTKTLWARTGFLGFLRQTQAITADGELHDALFVVGALDETLLLRGMRYHPVDIELCVCRAHRQICESAAFLWTNLLVIAAETSAPEADALDLVPAITSALLEEQHLIVGIVVLLDPGTIPMNSRGEKQRTHLRELFVRDQLDPIYVSYNL